MSASPRRYGRTTLDELERTSRAPAAAAAALLVASVVDCDIDRRIADDAAARFNDSGISGDAVDLLCLEAGVSDPGIALYFTTGNLSLLTPGLDATNPVVAVFDNGWAECVRGGRWFADSLSEEGGPVLERSSTECLDRWFEQDDRFVSYLSERLDELDEGLSSCLDTDEYDAFWSWVDSV